MFAVLENQLLADFAARRLGHQHDIRGILIVGGEAGFLAPLGERIKCVRQAGRIAALICTNLYNDFRHDAPEAPTTQPPG